MGRVAGRTDGRVRIAAHLCLAVNTALIRLKRAFMTFPARRAAHGLGQKLRPHRMRSVTVRADRGIPIALPEQTGMNAALMLLVLIRVTPLAYPRKGDRQFALVLELSERMGRLRVFTMAMGTLVAAVDRPPYLFFVDHEREGFPVY